MRLYSNIEERKWKQRETDINTDCDVHVLVEGKKHLLKRPYRAH